MRVEPSSAVPIYRQIVDQIKFQIASGTLRPGQQMPSVRELANRLAVNQNTILKVYNHLSMEQVLEMRRGNGTFVASGARAARKAEARAIVAASLRQAAEQAVQFGLDAEDVHKLLEREYTIVTDEQHRARSDES